MQIMLTDETNRLPGRDVKFFVYGGLVFPETALPTFHQEIEKIRDLAGYHRTDEFKFDTRSRPSDVSVENATEAKKDVINLCKSLDCKFIVYIILHDIIRYQEPSQYILWAADYVIGRFNRYLQVGVDDYGICIVDNLSVTAPYQYLTEKFSRGLITGHGARETRLDKILLFASTAVGAGHANSAMDIVLGSFRYCINNPRNRDAAKEMMGSVVTLLWHTRRGDTIEALDKGIVIRPRVDEIRVDQYREEYEKLFQHINELIEDQ